MARLRRDGLISVDEVGYLRFEQDAANTFFQLVSGPYQHASLILTSNLRFSGWDGVFQRSGFTAAMIDRVVRHAGVLTLKGASHRLRIGEVDTLPRIRTQDPADQTRQHVPVASFSNFASASISSLANTVTVSRGSERLRSCIR